MIHKLLQIFSVLMFVPLIMLAQHPSCNGSRYISEEFPKFNVTTGVQFGENTTIGGNTKTLFMDIYEPSGDIAEMRPLIVFVHGGGFIFGAREDMAAVCEAYTKRGFVTATIDYRLIDGVVTDSIGMADEIVKAVGDLRAAIRFFREDAATANIYKIDPDYIFSGGISAGAVTASTSAMLDSTDNIPQFMLDVINANGGFSGSSSANTQYSHKVSGVLNFSGSIPRDHWIDSQSPPFYSAHDEFDPVVPYGYGTSSIFSFPVYSYGSGAMKPVADAVGVTNELYTVASSGGHVSYFQEPTVNVILNASASFLHDVLCNSETSIAVNQQSVEPTIDLQLYPNPTNAEVTIEFQKLAGSYTVDIFNVLGEQVYSNTNDANVLRLNTNRFTSGIYFVRVQFANAVNNPIIQRLHILK